jgi:hypothetical protein
VAFPTHGTTIDSTLFNAMSGHLFDDADEFRLP